MAGMESIDAAGRALEEAVLDFATIVRVCDSINMDNPPDWLAMVFGRVLAIEDLVQAYMMAVHEHARPVLKDMAALSKSSGSGR